MTRIWDFWETFFRRH